MNAAVTFEHSTLPGIRTMIPRLTSGGGSSSEATEATHYVLGGAQLGVAIAEQLEAAGHRVVLVDEAYDSGDVPGYAGDPASVEILSASGVGTASTVVVATPSDRRNFFIGQLVRARFDVPRVIAIVHDPDRAPLFADAGHEPFCVTTALARAVGEST